MRRRFRIPGLDIHFCENRAADSVLGYYCTLAKREGIPFHAQIDLPERLPVDEVDLCLVLSNLLENALEASLRTASARRQMQVTAYSHADRLLLIEVKNTFDGEIKEREGVFRSSKRNRKRHRHPVRAAHRREKRRCQHLRLSERHLHSKSHAPRSIENIAFHRSSKTAQSALFLQRFSIQ